ncbi:hypothetical protein FK178_12650 [Antarcticibacterium arcticum]|uniref:Lipoprotein n=1 Tax=Antarcticibacterium arcticum TaxID=2585771 RepID=A0A5B8YKT6_9FLAO|nr:hypothetical protein [Antarcticibacterium arcticum]QED38512.1 hypothetical protein FK178_12650 [Antarcticibacterium arcticum]
MKKLLLVFFSVLLFSGCSAEDDSDNIMQNLAPVLSVDLPDSFEFGQSYNIEIIYKRPTNCHTFSGLDVARNANVIVIGVVTSYSTGNTNCVDSGNLEASATINFVAERDDFYIFKFWQGKNAAGRDEFLTVEVPVTQPGIE